jgi:hypothetical protein
MCAAVAEEPLDPRVAAMVGQRVRWRAPIWRSLVRWTEGEAELTQQKELAEKLCAHPNAYEFFSQPQFVELDLSRIRRLLYLYSYRNAEEFQEELRTFWRQVLESEEDQEKHARALSMLSYLEQLIGGEKAVRAQLPQQLLNLQPTLVELKQSKRKSVAAQDTVNRLIEAIAALEPEHQRELIQLVKQRQPNLILEVGNDEDDVEIDIDRMDQETLRLLTQFVNSKK